MKAILINIQTKRLIDINLEGELYPQLAPTIHCKWFDIVSTTIKGKEVSIYVDDEGLFVEGQEFFHVDGYANPLGGWGLIFGGSDEEGNTLEVPFAAREIEDAVSFPSLQQVIAKFG